MSTAPHEPVDSPTSEHVTGAELRMQQALADIRNGVGWSNDKQLAAYFGMCENTLNEICKAVKYPASQCRTK